MVRFTTVVVCLGTFLLASTAEAQYFGRNKVHYDRLNFRILQTKHFDIYYYPQEEEATRYAARMAERWYARYSEVLSHDFHHRQPLVLYASHPHFAQTNITPGSPSEATGGLTERVKNRIVMPFAAGLGETDHVLGHEIAHAFQIDIARESGQNAFNLPGWFIEGMAEYMSLGAANTNTSMWMRDAALYDRLPTLKELDSPKYFPYRYGHALWSYLTSRFGDELLGRVLRAKVRGGALKRLEATTGLDADQLTRDWHASISVDSSCGTNPEIEPNVVVGGAGTDARMHLGPALSPDGHQLLFLSERDKLSLDLFMADTRSGAVTAKIVSTAADPHFDSLQYVHSAGAWDPNGHRIAISAVTDGEPVLVIMDITQRDSRREIRLADFGEIYNPSWSPDGTRIVFSALKDGLSDLFLVNVETSAVDRLTADAFADLQPAWSPDGHAIAFATDRFTSRLSDLSFGALQVAVLDLRTLLIHPLLAGESDAKQIDPQWSPDAGSVYFISDREGVSNVYRFELASGALRQVTDVQSGISGITATSPALAVASQAGTLAFSIYRGGRYEIATLREVSAKGGREVMLETASTSPTPHGLLANLLGNAKVGLPAPTEFPSIKYDDRLRLESVAPPYLGAVTGDGFGGVLRGSIGFSFGDTLRDRELRTALRFGTDVDDFAAQIAYSNRRGRWNWGLAGGVVPARFFDARRAIQRQTDRIMRERTDLRYTHEWAGLTARYSINRSRRWEFSAGARRTGFEWQTITRINDLVERTTSNVLQETAAGKPVYLAEAQAAFVDDTSVSGPTGPIVGHRYRLELEPAVGRLAFTDVRVDLRRYFMPVRPFTIAARINHVGRYGPDASDSRLTPLVLGLQTLVRGYDLRAFAADECGQAATKCSLLDELSGSRLALLNLEIRAPLLGLLTGDIDYGRFPIEALAFVDAGLMWTGHQGSMGEQDRFRSVGAGARVNLGGIVFEMTAARPFDRSTQGWTASLLLRPGF